MINFKIQIVMICLYKYNTISNTLQTPIYQWSQEII